MAKQNAPFWDIDVTKLMSQFKFPGMSLDAAMAAQRRNIEALTTANQLAMEGMQSVARRQMEIVRQSMEEMASMATALMSPAAPEARLERQAELAKSAFERTLSNLKELGEMVSKSNAEAADVINRRIGEMLDEVKAAAKK
jgi:phasin family protein